MDPKNAYAEPVYLCIWQMSRPAHGSSGGIGACVHNLGEAEPSLLPAGLRIIVAVRQRHRELVIHSTFAGEPCAPSQLIWSDLRGENRAASNDGAVQRIEEHLRVREDKMTHF